MDFQNYHCLSVCQYITTNSHYRETKKQSYKTKSLHTNITFINGIFLVISMILYYTLTYVLISKLVSVFSKNFGTFVAKTSDEEQTNQRMLQIFVLITKEGFILVNCLMKI